MSAFKKRGAVVRGHADAFHRALGPTAEICPSQYCALVPVLVRTTTGVVMPVIVDNILQYQQPEDADSLIYLLI